nr:PREDICTED: tyrosine-protein phosphatase non-receptor type 23 [Latimeria chalumnae]|eukprot:XP_014353134.1 PREDICTED: tyrosine-protein phosphatase non-receptor type 23 [Latimeria chalumnae]
MGKQAEEQQKYGERLAYLQSALDKLNEAIKLSKQCGTKNDGDLSIAYSTTEKLYNSAKKDNDFIYHEAVPALDTLPSVKGAPLVKALPVNPTDPSVTGPDIFSKLVPMAAHEASSLYSEEKAKLLRDIMSKIESKNEVLEQFMDSLRLDPETVDNLDMYSHIPPILMEKCAALSVRPDTVKNLIQSMQGKEEQRCQFLSVHMHDVFIICFPHPSEDKGVLQNVKRMLSKVQEMKEQRISLEKQLREMIQKDDITTALVTADRSEMKRLFEEQLKKYEQLKVYIEQNLTAQENILKALTEANVKYAAVRKILTEAEHKWNTTVQSLVASYETYEDLMKKSQEGKEFYSDLESKVARLLEKAKGICKECEEERQQILEKEVKKKPPPRPTAPKPPLQKRTSDVDLESLPNLDDIDLQNLSALALTDLPEDLRSLPPEVLESHLARLSMDGISQFPMSPAVGFPGMRPVGPEAFLGARASCHPLLPPVQSRSSVPFNPLHFHSVPGQMPLYGSNRTVPPTAVSTNSVQGPFPAISHSGLPHPSGGPALSQQMMRPPGPSQMMPPQSSVGTLVPNAQGYPTTAVIRGPVSSSTGPPPVQPGFPVPARGPSHQHMPVSVSAPHPFNTALPNVSYGVSHQIPSSVTVPGLHPAQFSGPVPGGNDIPQQSQGIRPSTTTVDSIQAPIPSFPQVPRVQMPRPAFNNQPTVNQQGMFPGSGFGIPPRAQMGSAGSYAYPQCGIQQFSQQTHPHFPLTGPPSHMYQPPAQVQVSKDLQVRPPPVQPQQPYLPQPQFIPQSRLQMQPQAQHSQHPHFQAQLHPQQRGMTPSPVPPQSQLPPQAPAQVPSQPTVPSQIPPQAIGQAQIPTQHGQHYQLPSHNALPQQGLPQQPGSLSFPNIVPRGTPQQLPNIPSSIAPQSQQLHSHPSNTKLQSVPPASATQVSPMPFGHAPSAVHPGHQQATLQNQMPAAAQIPMVAPQTASAGQPTPHHIPPSLSPALNQIQPSVIGPRPPTPSPSPSPQPSMSLQPSTMIPPSMPAMTSLPPIPPASLTPGASSITQGSTEVSFQRQSSSTDDLLSSSPESQHGGSKPSVNQPLLLPTKADSKDGQKPKGIQLIEKDPYEKPEHIIKLLSELDNFRSIVDSLEKPGSMSVTDLDYRWKDLQDAQEKDARQFSIAIARCYTMKNRHQDIMPFDKNRIVLQSGKDDYINASIIEDLSSYCPRIIATQAPLVGTASDFWLMIYEQKVSLIVMLVSEQEVEKQKVIRYFPTERGQQMMHGPITLILTSVKVTQTHLERMITLQYRDQSLKRTIVHLQFTSWPELGLPDSKSNLVRFVQEVNGHYFHQRPLHMPVVVHCSSGVGRTGAFCLVYAAMQEVEAGNGIPDLALLVRKMRQQRKHMLQEKLHLKFCYETVLKHVEQVLQRHGIMPPSSNKAPNAAAQKLYSHQESQDIVLGGDMPISSIQATIAKLSIKPFAVGVSSDSGEDLEFIFQPSTDIPTEEVNTDAIVAALPPLADVTQTEFAAQVPSQQAEPQSQGSPVRSPPLSPLLTETSGAKEESFSSVQPQTDTSQSPAESLIDVHPPGINHAVVAAATTTTTTMGIPTSSSLDLLASLTPEAFTLDSSLKGKQKINKQSFLQPQNGQGLRVSGSTSDDPLSMLDPLWTLNKT